MKVIRGICGFLDREMNHPDDVAKLEWSSEWGDVDCVLAVTVESQHMLVWETAKAEGVKSWRLRGRLDHAFSTTQEAEEFARSFALGAENRRFYVALPDLAEAFA
jgi:hypothetical protein